LVGADILDSGAEQASVEGDGVFAWQSQLDCDIGAMAFTGFGEWSVEEGADFGQAFKAMTATDGIDKTLGGAPGA